MNRPLIVLLIVAVMAGIAVGWGTQWQHLYSVKGYTYLRNRWTGEILSCYIYANPDVQPNSSDDSQVRWGYRCVKVPLPRSIPKAATSPAAAASAGLGTPSDKDAAVSLDSLWRAAKAKDATTSSSGAHDVKHQN